MKMCTIIPVFKRYCLYLLPSVNDIQLFTLSQSVALRNNTSAFRQIGQHVQTFF